MFEHPTKVFPCDCGGEGIAVTKYHDEDDISEGEVLVSEDEDMRDCMESPFIDFSFWEFGHRTHGRWSWWWRLKIAWRVFRKGTPWPDMVIMRAAHAKNFANHILYLITKGEKEKKLGEPIVKDDGLPYVLDEKGRKRDPESGAVFLESPGVPYMEKDQATDPLGDTLIAELGHGGKIPPEDWDELPPLTEPIHPYFCVQHGGSAACEESNKKHGFTCPKCDQDKIIADVRKR